MTTHSNETSGLPDVGQPMALEQRYRLGLPATRAWSRWELDTLAFYNKQDAAIAALEGQRNVLYAAAENAIEAFRLTREYVGEDLLPMLPGWSHFDAVEQLRRALGQPVEEASILGKGEG